jgi:DNA repair protein RadA/Sms
MPRSKEQQRTVFLCQECGYESSRWMVFCPSPGCGSAGPLAEAAIAPPGPSSRHPWAGAAAEPLRELSQLDPDEQRRIPLPSAELNRVLGGGIVPGSVSLLAGAPGVGKSTLLLQIARYISSTGQPVLYASGEESPHQIKLRSQRLGIPGQAIFLLSETDVTRILARLEECRPALAIVDSIQTLFTREAASGPGSVAQVRECGLQLLRWAKQRSVPLLIAGHMTKDGSLAGPRVLEHMVDTVMYLEGEDLNSYRILRSGKNRFGPTTEVGVFEMTGQGLVEVPDPSQALLAQRCRQAVGAALVPVLEGTRPLLLEVQALTSPSYAPVPRRVANGVDYNRLLMLTAVASRRAALDVAGQDVIVSIAGGFKVTEPAVDLGLVMAIASSLHNRPIDSRWVVLGEVGLSGELRNVPQVERRLQEASRLGLTRCILPEAARRDVARSPDLELIFAGTVRDALKIVLGPHRVRNQEIPAEANSIETS